MTQLSISASGRPYANCPKCARIHSISRRRDYATKPNVRFTCTHCGTTWRASDEERAMILEYFKDKPAAPGAAPKNNKQAPTAAPVKKPEPPKKEEQKALVSKKKNDVWAQFGL